MIRLEVDTGPEVETVLRAFMDMGLEQRLSRMSTERRQVMEFYLERFEVVHGIESTTERRGR